MSIQIKPSHVALLVPSVRKAADHLKQFGFQIGKEEIWDGEGTKEIYIESGSANSLLLMEPVKPGAYQRALEKRGPGLHHVAIDVLDIENYLESLSGSGWLLHPSSIKTIKQTKTAYLARPGFPTLIEVQQKDKLGNGENFVQEIHLKFDPKLLKLIESVGQSEIIKPSVEETSLRLRGKNIPIKELF